jgi:putative holliday junction resolvase
MGAVLALDIGGKRTGVAVSDEGRTFAFPLDTVETQRIPEKLKALIAERQADGLVVGLPGNLNNQATDATPVVLNWLKKIRALFPQLEIYTVDERFTSSMARKALVAGGMKKSDREKKENTDKVSATLILQSFLEQYLRFGPEGISKY